MYIVKTLRQMNYLCNKGFQVKKIEKDIHNSDKVVFAFEKSKELLDCLNNYYKEKNIKRK